MQCKCLEIRDAGTRLCVLAIRMAPDNDAQRALLAAAGYGTVPALQSQYVLMLDLHDVTGHFEPRQQPSTTRLLAHQYIMDRFDALTDGDVVDVQHIHGLTTVAKKSEVQGRY